ncbi:MAG TPA: Gfo/Idh/MocA family oxidoreductase [Tepidisphaeraceae bacterium]|nr:Gfo/Idh/MocA family oxidoreductase [Tepidisphaeraceae bacterium]
MSKQWRCAVVGTGVVGGTHVRVIPQLPQAKLVAICDVKPENSLTALKKAEISDVPIYTSQREMLRKEQIDVVHIATPSGVHMEPALEAIEAGVNIICEKPLEITLERADRIIEAAAKKNVRVGCIFQNRWKPENRAIRKAAEENRFGKVTWAGSFTPWYRTDKYYEDGGWRGTWKFDGGGAVMNQSIHSIDLLQWIAGPVRRVSAYAASRIHAKIEVEDTLTCALQFESGAFGTILGTTALFPGQPPRIEIGGENGTAIAENGLKVFTFRDETPEDKQLLEQLSPNSAASPTKSNPGAINNQAHGGNIAGILQAWEEGREAETNAVEARKSLAIVLAMYESARRDGEPVDVK